MLLKRWQQKGWKAAKVAKGIDDKGQSESDPLFWEVFGKWCSFQYACEKNPYTPSNPRCRHGWCLGGNFSAQGHAHAHLGYIPIWATLPMQIPNWPSCYNVCFSWVNRHGCEVHCDAPSLGKSSWDNPWIIIIKMISDQYRSITVTNCQYYRFDNSSTSNASHSDTLLIIYLHESQIGIYILERVYIKSITVFEHCETIPILRNNVSEPWDQMGAPNNWVHRNNTCRLASTLS